MNDRPKYDELVAHNEHLQSQLTEALDIIDAIRKGEVDAFVIKQNNVHELYTLKTADHTYRLFIEKMKEGAVTLNKEYTVLYANSSFANMVNIPLEKVIGIPFSELMPEVYREQILLDLEAAWTTEIKTELMLPGLNKEFPVLLSVNTLEIDSELTLSVIFTDLSFQKEAQQQKKELEMKDEFISIASHELKTPVTSIKGYIQLLRHTFKQEGNLKAEEFLGRADAQVNKLSTLIRDLLDVKKIETGQLLYQEERFSLNELVSEMLGEMGRGLNMQSLKYDIGPDCKVFGDRNKVAQVISNFIDNAAKYSPKDSTITVNTDIREGLVRLSVADQGIGVPIEQQGKIFERFFRVHSTAENTYSGLGLGLYICADIIKRHKGKIGVESSKGNGAVFYFELPVAENN
jgi:PAS domain S-box-containing protein